MGFFGRLISRITGPGYSVSSGTAPAPVTVVTAPPTMPSTIQVLGGPAIIPADYRGRLQQVIASGKFKSIADNPNTPENERRTYCNLFVRHVARWFGFTEWKPDNVDGERAADIHRWMVAHPARWLRLEGSTRYIVARDFAERGRLVVYSHIYSAPTPGPSAPGSWSASGHVCIGAPEHALWTSGTWKADVPMVANIGGKEFYGESVSQAFAKPCDGMFVYLG